MRSLLRYFVLEARAARTDLFFAWLAFVAFLIGGCTARGDESHEAESRAALALAKAKRERETTSCFADYEAAVAAARRADKHLVLWVGDEVQRSSAAPPRIGRRNSLPSAVADAAIARRGS